ncbi:Helitron helicase, partial [Phytophthora megakarya]
MWDNATINKWIVPYNPYLSQKYNCHINREVCATNKAVKYIYKYVYKDSDMTTITIEGEEIQTNEILQYMAGRYISHPMSMVTYRDQATTLQLQNLIRRGDRPKLTAFFYLCARDPEGTENLLYKDVPKKYRWDDRSKRWTPYKKYKDFSEDYFKSIDERQNNFERDEEVRLRMAEYKCLKWVAEYLLSNGKTLDMYDLPELSTYQDVSEQVEREDTDPRGVVGNEIATYDPEDLARTTALADQINENQKEVFDQVFEAVNHPVDGQKLCFVDEPGGTGKSFLLEQKLSHVRLQKKVASIAVASSGIAATLLTGGHTVHSTFRIPLKLSKFSTWSLPWQSQKAELIRNASLIIWDEAPMMHPECFEAVDRSFRDIMKNDLEPFGGKVMVFSGDHRQILP